MNRLLTPTTPPPRLALNVGAGIDLTNGVFLKGKYGEDILIGGLSNLQGVMGDPNNHKTTTAVWMMMSGMNTVAYSHMSEMLAYDAEGTLRIERINNLSSPFQYLDRDEDGNPIITFTNISEKVPEEWFDKTFSPYIKSKRESKEYEVEIEFLFHPKTKKVLKMKVPTAMLLDTITYFDPSTTHETIMGVGSNESKNKTFGLHNSKFKTDIMSTMTASTLRTNTYAIIVAHMGDNINMDAGMYSPKQRKQIGTLASNEKIKGVPANYTRLLTSLWQSTGKRNLVHAVTKLAEYPIGGGRDKIEKELQLITMKQHRSKDNSSDIYVSLAISQTEGVLPHLSQFLDLKKNKFGFEGNAQFYNLVLCPDVKLSRTTIRGIIDSNEKIRRAIEITHDLYLIQLTHPEYGDLGLFCTIEELYKDIDEMGYDWNKIFTLTRNWWTPKQYTTKLKYLHLLNLLKIRKGLYEYKEVLKLISKDKV